MPRHAGNPPTPGRSRPGSAARWPARPFPAQVQSLPPTGAAPRAGAAQRAPRTARMAASPGRYPWPTPICQESSARAHSNVHPVPTHAPRGSCRRRGALAPPAGARRLRAPGGAGDLLLAAAGLPGAAQRRADRARGDERGRLPGGPLPGAPAARALRADQPVDRVRAQPVPARRPTRRRLPARADARGDVHPAGQGPVLLLQGPAGLPVPDPDEVPRRGASPRGHPARPRVRHEGLLLVRQHRRGSRGELREAPRRVHHHLRPAAASSTRSSRRCPGPWVGPPRRSSWPRRPVGEDTFVRCTVCDYAANVEAVASQAPAAGAVRRAARGARRGHTRHPDHPDARRPVEQLGPSWPAATGRGPPATP